MYLKQLYKQHKGWFLFVVLFIAGQFFINFKRGVVFSPFYHYGMYSEKMELSDSMGACRIIVNNKELEPFNYSAQTWDKLTLPLYYYGWVQKHDSTSYFTDGKRLLSKLSIPTNETNFITPPFNFTDWYKHYLESILGEKVDSFSYNISRYPIQRFSYHSKPVFRTP